MDTTAAIHGQGVAKSFRRRVVRIPTAIPVHRKSVVCLLRRDRPSTTPTAGHRRGSSSRQMVTSRWAATSQKKVSAQGMFRNAPARSMSGAQTKLSEARISPVRPAPMRRASHPVSRQDTPKIRAGKKRRAKRFIPIKSVAMRATKAIKGGVIHITPVEPVPAHNKIQLIPMKTVALIHDKMEQKETES